MSFFRPFLSLSISVILQWRLFVTVCRSRYVMTGVVSIDRKPLSVYLSVCLLDKCPFLVFLFYSSSDLHQLIMTFSTTSFFFRSFFLSFFLSFFFISFFLTWSDIVIAWRSSNESVGLKSLDSGGLDPMSDPSGCKSRIFPMTHFCVTWRDWKWRK